MSEQPNEVRCPECGEWQGDMGRNVPCETCGEAPMPSYSYPAGSELYPEEAAEGGP